MKNQGEFSRGFNIALDLNLPVQFLKFVRTERYFLNSDGLWYSTKHRHDYSQPAPVYTEQELFDYWINKYKWH